MRLLVLYILTIHFYLFCTLKFLNFIFEILTPLVAQHDNDISAYTYERTLVMEQRCRMLRQMKGSIARRVSDVSTLQLVAQCNASMLGMSSLQLSVMHEYYRMSLLLSVTHEKWVENAAECDA